MSQPTRKEVQAFIDALKYGIKVSHKPEFLIALAEGWLSAEKSEQRKKAALSGSVMRSNCVHEWCADIPHSEGLKLCSICGEEFRR